MIEKNKKKERKRKEKGHPFFEKNDHPPLTKILTSTQIFLQISCFNNFFSNVEKKSRCHLFLQSGEDDVFHSGKNSGSAMIYWLLFFLQNELITESDSHMCMEIYSQQVVFIQLATAH